MKKFLLLFILGLPLSVAGFGLFSIMNANIDDVTICAINDDSHYIPSSVCEYYLFNHRLTQEDIQYLETNSSGIAFVFGIKDQPKRDKYLRYFVKKGVSTNKLSVIDGLTPLHAAVVINDAELVKFLLENGADPMLKDSQYKLASIDFVDYLQKKNPSTDRLKVRQQLQEYGRK